MSTMSVPYPHYSSNDDDTRCDYCGRPACNARPAGDELLCHSCQRDQRQTYRQLGKTFYELGYGYPADESYHVRQGWLLAQRLDQPIEERAA